MVGSAVTDRLSTGIDGLDEITNGGFLAGRSFLVRGPPGAGKSLLGLHFLTAEAAATPLFVNMGEPAADVRENAASFGFDLDVELLDLSPDADAFVDRETYTVFASGEVEGAPLAEEIGDAVEAVDPDRVFVDPMTQLRYLAPDAHQFRRQVLSFLRYLKGHGATVLFTSQDSPNTPDDDLQFMADGESWEVKSTVTPRANRKRLYAGPRNLRTWQARSESDSGCCSPCSRSCCTSRGAAAGSPRRTSPTRCSSNAPKPCRTPSSPSR
jgi:KaiC/GvpD/RAD55 family RecA-like ATPase